jgi:ABC-type glycerol-3-phosphate transport system substrate-binding protein
MDMQLKPNRRSVLLGGAALSASSLLARPALAQSKPDSINFLCVVGGWGDILYNHAIPEFEEKTGIKVESTLLPADGLETRLRTELLSGSGEVDVCMFSPNWVGWMLPYMSDMKEMQSEFGSQPDDTDWDTVPQGARNMMTYKGKIAGFPYRTLVEGFFCQEGALKEAGIAEPPKTFDEFLTAAKAVTKAGGGKRFGVGYEGKVGLYTQTAFSPYLLSFGGNYYDQDTYEVLVNKPASVEAVEFFCGMYNKDHVVPPEAITWQPDEIIAGGQTDRYAMALLTLGWGTQINGNGPSTKGKWATEGKWTFPALPAKMAGGGRSFVGGWGFGVPSDGSNREWAYRLVQHVSNKIWLPKSIESGNIPPLPDAQVTDEIKEKYPWAAANDALMQTALLGPRDDIWPQMQLRMSTGISEVLSGQKEAQKAMDEVAEDWETKFRRAGLKS